MKKILALLLAFACGMAQAQVAQLQAFKPTGNTITITANTSGNIPTPVQTVTVTPGTVQYVLTNVGSVTAFISYSNTSAGATTNCVVPSSTEVMPLLAYSQIVITTVANAYWCGITSSGTAVIYVTPGAGT